MKSTFLRLLANYCCDMHQARQQIAYIQHKKSCICSSSTAVGIQQSYNYATKIYQRLRQHNLCVSHYYSAVYCRATTTNATRRSWETICSQSASQASSTPHALPRCPVRLHHLQPRLLSAAAESKYVSRTVTAARTVVLESSAKCPAATMCYLSNNYNNNRLSRNFKAILPFHHLSVVVVVNGFVQP